MRSPIHENHFSDGEGRPAFVEDIIAAAIGRIEFYQRSRLNCAENQRALEYLNLAAEALAERRKNREARGVEGTPAV